MNFGICGEARTYTQQRLYFRDLACGLRGGKARVCTGTDREAMGGSDRVQSTSLDATIQLTLMTAPRGQLRLSALGRYPEETKSLCSQSQRSRGVRMGATAQWPIRRQEKAKEGLSMALGLLTGRHQV